MLQAICGPELDEARFFHTWTAAREREEAQRKQVFQKERVRNPDPKECSGGYPLTLPADDSRVPRVMANFFQQIMEAMSPAAAHSFQIGDVAQTRTWGRFKINDSRALLRLCDLRECFGEWWFRNNLEQIPNMYADHVIHVLARRYFHCYSEESMPKSVGCAPISQKRKIWECYWLAHAEHMHPRAPPPPVSDAAECAAWAMSSYASSIV